MSPNVCIGTKSQLMAEIKHLREELESARLENKKKDAIIKHQHSLLKEHRIAH